MDRGRVGKDKRTHYIALALVSIFLLSVVMAAIPAAAEGSSPDNTGLTPVFPAPSQCRIENATELALRLYTLLDLPGSLGPPEIGEIGTWPNPLVFSAEGEGHGPPYGIPINALEFHGSDGSMVQLSYDCISGNYQNPQPLYTEGSLMGMLVYVNGSAFKATDVDDYVPVAQGVADRLGLDNFTSCTFHRTGYGRTTVILSSSLDGLNVTGANLLAVTFDDVSKEVRGIQSTLFFDLGHYPLLSKGAALEAGRALLANELQDPADLPISEAIVGLRLQPVTRTLWAPGPLDDPYNSTTWNGQVVDYHLAYEYLTNVRSNTSVYSVYVCIDALSGADLTHEQGAAVPSQTFGQPGGIIELLQEPIVIVPLVISVVFIGLFVLSPEFALFSLTWVVVPLAIRLRGARVLDNFNRGRIYGFISGQPGSSYSDIRTALGIGNGNLAYHLVVLEKLELIQSVKEGRLRLYFPRGVAARTRPEQSLGLTELKILNELYLGGPDTNNGLAQRLGMSRQRTHYNLKLLKKRCLVEERDQVWKAVDRLEDGA